MKTLQTLTDDQLVARFEKGDSQAFDCLLSRYQDRLFAYINFSVRDEDKANDIFQDTFVKAIMTIRQGRYTASGRFYPWLTRIAHNLIIDEYRNLSGETYVDSEDAEMEVSDRCIEAEMIDAQVLDDVKLLMNELPEEQRRVLYMRIYQDMSFKEIADETGVSINTALGRMRYAVLNMRKMAEERQIFAE